MVLYALTDDSKRVLRRPSERQERPYVEDAVVKPIETSGRRHKNKRDENEKEMIQGGNLHSRPEATSETEALQRAQSRRVEKTKEEILER